MFVQLLIVQVILLECIIILVQENVNTVYIPVRHVPLPLHVYNVVGILKIEIIIQVVVVNLVTIKMDKNVLNV